jgi:hypothetical protein
MIENDTEESNLKDSNNTVYSLIKNFPIVCRDDSHDTAQSKSCHHT